MARDARNKPAKGFEEQEEMTVVILRFKGGGDTLRKGFDTVSHALSALGPPISRRGLPHYRPPEMPPTDPGDEPEPDAEEVQQGDLTAAEDYADTPRPRRKPAFLSGFDLAPDGQIAWKDYAAKKSPRTLDEKYLVAAGWVTKHGGQEVFTIPHIFSCFRAMKWEEQADFSQPIRRLKSTNSYFDVLKRGQWKLTGLGIEAVDKLPQGDSE